MNTFQEIPTEILRIIQRYLNKQDYINLLNTNKTIFDDAKYETVYYNIHINKERVHQLTKYLTFFYESMRDKSHQISLTIINPTEKIVEKCAAFMPGIHQLIFRGYSNWRNNPNMSLFCNIYHVHLECIHGLARLSGLSGIKILEVIHSRSLIAIDFIPGLKRLVLNRLFNLLEISAYGNIPELKIFNCDELSLEGLGNHERVSLTRSDQISNDLPRFQTVKYLELKSRDYSSFSCLPVFINLIYLSCVCDGSQFLFDPSSFPNLQFLYLNSAKITSEVSFPSSLQFGDFDRCSFHNLSILSNVKELKFNYCEGRGFNNVNPLSNAYRLHLVFIPELKDVSSLGRVYDLRIISSSPLKGIRRLGGVHRLEVWGYGVKSLEGLGQGNSEIVLWNLSWNVHFSPFRSIYKVTLENCNGLVDGKDLANVQHLSISCCQNFEDTSALGKVKSLSLLDCNNLKRLVGLENVSHIRLERCSQLEDINCLGKQQSLIIYQCIRLDELIERDVRGRYKRIFAGILFVRKNIPAFSLSANFVKSLDFFEVKKESANDSSVIYQRENKV